MGRPEAGPRRSASSVSNPPLDEEKIVQSRSPSSHSGLPRKDEHGEEPAAEPRAGDGPPATRVHSVNHVDSIPNGGLQAWLQVLGAFFLFFNSWGVINTFGSYQAYYTTELLKDSTPSAISWIGSIQSFLLLLVGAISGPIYDAGYFRPLLLTGSFLLVFGQMMLSLCEEYWQVILAQAFCMGIGAGCLFIPSVAILSTYFTTRIASATGLAASGSSLGGVLYPIMFHKLMPTAGFGWSTRAIAFLMLATLIVPNTLMRVRVLPAQRRALLDLPAFREPPYAIFVFGGFIGFMGLYMPFFYSQVYAIRENITTSNLAFYLLAILNSASIFGRIIPNLFADRVGPFNVIVPCAVISGILCLCLIAVHSTGSIVVFELLYGFFSGTMVSLPPTIVVHLSLRHRGKIGTRMGMCFAVVAIGLLIGAPIGGVILNGKGFWAVWVFGGVLLVSGGLIMGVARVMQVGWGLVKA